MIATRALKWARCGVAGAWILGLLCGPPAVAANSAEIRLLPKAEVQLPDIYLTDIAAVDCADPVLKDRLAQTVIAPAPLPGRSRNISAALLEVRLRQNGIAPEQIRLSGTAETRVHRRVREVDESKIKAIVSNYIRRQQLWGDADVRIDHIHVDSDRTLPPGRTVYHVVPARDLTGIGTLPLSVVFEVDGRYRKTIRAVAKIQVIGKVVVTRRPIGRYKPIEAVDIEMCELDLNEVPANALIDIDDVIGQRARRNIPANVVLRPDLVEFPPLVKRGDLVRIVAQSAGLEISDLGEVRNTGRRGDRVSVLNLASRKRISARVIDKDTVRVDF
jgi:flagella basal body P-ring formation protein FlgA